MWPHAVNMVMLDIIGYDLKQIATKTSELQSDLKKFFF